MNCPWANCPATKLNNSTKHTCAVLGGIGDSQWALGRGRHGAHNAAAEASPARVEEGALAIGVRLGGKKHHFTVWNGKGVSYVATEIVQRRDVSIFYSVIL